MVYIVDDAADYRFLVKQVFKMFLPQYPLRLFADGLELMQEVDQPVRWKPARTVEVAHGATFTSVAGGTHPEQPERLMPSLIMLDVDMPKLNGYQTLERLKQDPDWQSVPVVMMSNRIDPEFTLTAQQMGAVSYIAKPLNISEMKTVMEQLCQQWLSA